MSWPDWLARFLGRHPPVLPDMPERAEVVRRLREQDARLRRLDAQIDARREKPL